MYSQNLCISDQMGTQTWKCTNVKSPIHTIYLYFPFFSYTVFLCFMFVCISFLMENPNAMFIHFPLSPLSFIFLVPLLLTTVWLRVRISLPWSLAYWDSSFHYHAWLIFLIL